MSVDVERLLADASAARLSGAARTASDELLIIDPETRQIAVPENFLLGVESDQNVERVRFQCPKIVGDNIDLSKLHIYVNYRNANQEVSSYWCQDVEVEGDNITFSWLVSRAATMYQGETIFIVCAKKSDEEGNLTNEWNTTIPEHGGIVLEGLEPDPRLEQQYPDVIEQILTELDTIKAGGGSGGNVTIDNTLTQEGQAADAKATGEALNKKLEKNQGSQNSGKFLGVGDDGNIVLKNAPESSGETEISQEQIEEAVNKYFIDHPESTTSVPDGGITETKIADQAVTAAKIYGSSYEKTGLNYVNPKTCIDGYYINASGEEIANASYRITDKIPVGENKYASISKLVWDGNSYIAFYDANDNFISATKYGQSNIRICVEVPESTSYVKVGFPLIENTYPILLFGESYFEPHNTIITLPEFSKYISEKFGDVSIGTEFTSSLKDIPLSAIDGTNAEYYNLFSKKKDEQINGYYLPVRPKYFIYSMNGGWANTMFIIKCAYKNGSVKSLFLGAYNDTVIPVNVNITDDLLFVFIETNLSEEILNGIMISTRDDLKKYYSYGEIYFEPSDEMKALVQASNEDIIKQYAGGMLLGIGDSYMQNNTALTEIATNHGLEIDNRGVASSSISGDEAQTVGLYPFWLRINTIVSDYTTGKTINEQTYHCEDVKLIVFMGGANDGWIDYRRGSGKTETDTNTIYGALNSCFSSLASNFPNADIIVILQPTNYNVSSSGWDDEMAKGYGFADLAEAQKFSDYQLGQLAMHTKEAIVKEMAELYGFNIVDCCFNWYSVLNPNDRIKYWKTDKLHMTSDGNYAIYKIALEDAINNLKITRNP